MTTVAIDFGTSNTVVCILESDTRSPRTIRFPSISRFFKTIVAGETHEVAVVPTLVFVGKDGKVLLGEAVRSQRLGFVEPQRLFQAFKRDMAADFRPPARQVDGSSYSAENIAELFLGEILQQLQALQIEADQVIFSVPVGAFEAYLDWFRDFAQKQSLPAIQLVDESTAAALGYAVQRPGTLVLVVDFGGGTLDLSLVRTARPRTGSKIDKAEVLAKSDAYIGGVDIDTWIVEHHLRQMELSRAEAGEIGWQNLLEIAEKLKIQLSSTAEVKESWFDDENFIAYELKLNREEFAEILETNQLLEQLRQALDEVLAIALSKGVNKAAIEHVLLVGGSCQIPAVQQLIISYFGKQKVRINRPFEAVAYGALVLGEAIQVDDYLRHGYAIRLWEPYAKIYSYFSLFEKGMKYPCQRSETLTLQVAVEGQREIRLDIGEIADVSQTEVTYDDQGRMTSSQIYRQSDFRSLADVRVRTPISHESQNSQVCIAHLDPSGQTGMDRIEVAFEVNEQRILLATVRDLLTQKILVHRGAIAKLE